MTLPAYEQLADVISLRPGVVPVIKGRELYAILEELFTPEEAGLAAQMPLSPVAAAGFAAEIGGDPGKVKGLLESMADKGLLFSNVQSDVAFYTLITLIPGMFEMQFMKGEVSDHARRLAHLFGDYFNTCKDAAKLPLSSPTFPLSRVITVEKEIPVGVGIHPYDQASQYIIKSEYIALATCYCRHNGELLGHSCDKPKDVCISLGLTAKFVAERGFGKLISKEEALKVLERAEKAGLVHVSSNTSKHIEFICNCCVCHCVILQTVKNAASPSMAASSSFIAIVDQEECMGCGDCVGMCPMEALSIEGDIVVRDDNRCIGCGLCVSTCPTNALRLEAREGAPVPPLEHRELNAAVMDSMPKSEK